MKQETLALKADIGRGKVLAEDLCRLAVALLELKR